MLRILLLVLLLCGPVYGQVYLGLHGAGSWSKLTKVAGEDVGDSYDDYERVYGFGGDIMFRPTASPFGIEAGFTYLSKTDEDGDIESKGGAHPIYVSGVFFISNSMYLTAGVNYTLWNLEVNEESLDNIDGKLGYQGGVGIELGSGKIRLYGVGYYMIQKGEVTDIPDIPELDGQLPDTIEFETQGFLIRAGIRIGL